MKSQQICDILGVTKEGLKSILRRNQLAARLLEKGYRLIKIEKVGRANEFHVEEIVIVPKEKWEDYVKREFPTLRKTTQLGNYCEERLVKQSISTKEISTKVGVTEHTVDRWDSILVEKGIMSENGYSYFRILPNKKPLQITYTEYVSYWRQYKRLQTKELEEILEGEEEVTSNMIKVAKLGMCVKVKSYLVHQFTEKYEELVSVLENRKG